MKRKPLSVYICSPYSPTTKYTKIPIIRSIVRYLRARQVTKLTSKLIESFNIAPIGPITQSHQFSKFLQNKDGGFGRWSRMDYKYIDIVEEVWVLMMKGVEQSEGVTKEMKYAKKLKKPIKIFYLDDAIFN